LLVRDGDSDDLADKLERLLRNPALRERLQLNGEAHVRDRFAPDRAIARFLSIYDAAAHDRRAH
jgi:glycosyltransferase involved in cell wall biosynthesis